MNSLFQLIERYWVQLTLLCLSVITVLSLYPLEHLPGIPGTDKSHHLIAYALLAFPSALKRVKYWPILALFFIFFGGLIELIQPYVNRYGEWYDLLANSAGVLLGVSLAFLIKRMTSRIDG